MAELSEEDATALKGALDALREELTVAVGAAADGAAPVDLDQPIGRVSRVDALQQQAMVKAGRQAAKLRLQQVEAALRRFESDDYGFCLECGDGIGADRLRARPEAPFCLACQSKSEARSR